MTTGDLSARRWRTYRAAILPTLGTTCHICGQPVDTTLSGRHPQGPHVDHITPRAHGGAMYDHTNVALAHNKCNASKGSTTPQRIQSRDW